MKSILITGANGDIGRAAVGDALNRGFRVFATVRNEAHIETFERSNRLHGLVVHVDRPSSVADGFNQIDAVLAGDPLNAVMHCAAIEKPSTVEFMDLGQLETTLKVNAIGSLAVMQQAFPRLRASAGNLVLAGSIWGLASGPLVGGYSASKWALESLATAARRETLGMGFHITIANIGAVKSRMLDSHVQGVRDMLATADDEEQKHYGAAYAAHIENTKRFDAMSSSVQDVAAKLVDIAARPRPARRYVIGKDARLIVTLQRMLPTALMDKVLGLPRNID